MTAPGILQACGRCGSSWPVALGPNGPVPARWCPRCRGALLAPVSAAPPRQHRPAPRDVRAGLPRGYRWIARMPAPPAEEGEATLAAPALGPTPRYRDIPRWGLPVGPAPVAASDTTARKYESWASSSRATMRILVWVLTLGVIAEAFRYALLLWNQSHLVGRLTVAISDALSLVIGVLAPLVVLLAAAGCAGWLARTRAAHYGRSGWRDPRSTRSIYLGVMIPGWNLLMPGVFLTELALTTESDDAVAGGPGLPPTGAAEAPRVGRLRELRERLDGVFAELSGLWLVRFWWGMWVLTNITVVGVVLARFDTSMQGRANGVLFTLYAYVLALAVAGLTLKVMARFEEHAVAPRAEPARWLIAT